LSFEKEPKHKKYEKIKIESQIDKGLKWKNKNKGSR